MDPVSAFGAMGAGAASIGGGLLGSALQAKRARKAAKKQRDFAERMSSTQYQRGVKDLEKAGLSKLLAYGNLQTSSPQGSMAQTPDTGRIGSDAVQSALQARRQGAELKLIGEQTESIRLKNKVDRPKATLAEIMFNKISSAYEAFDVSKVMQNLDKIDPIPKQIKFNTRKDQHPAAHIPGKNKEPHEQHWPQDKNSKYYKRHMK